MMLKKCFKRVLFCFVSYPFHSNAKFLGVSNRFLYLSNSVHSSGFSSSSSSSSSIQDDIIVNSVESNILKNNTNFTSTNEPIEVEQIANHNSKEVLVQYSQVYNFHLTNLQRLSNLYKNKFTCISIPQFPHCEIYLCGTLHVTKKSTEMVVDAISSIKPHYVVLELCEARADSLFDMDQPNITLSDVFRETFQQKSLKVLGMGLLSWMQMKSANMLGNRLGGEITAAFQVATKQGVYATILGDRLYGVTIQRAFDRLSMLEKIKVGGIMFWEAFTLSFMKLADYIAKTESDDKFIQEEIKRFRKYLPSFASVIIDERDEYLAQSIIETGKSYR
jgi:hypothetical protein